MKLKSDNHIVIGILFACIAVWIGIILLNSRYRSFNQDEFEVMHSAWKLSHGEKIFTEYYEHHHPLLHYCIMPLLKIWGETTTAIITARLLIFCMVIGILLCTYLLAALVFNYIVGLLSVIFTASLLLFLNTAIEIRPDVPQVLCGMIALYFLALFFEKKNDKYLYMSAFALAFSFLFLQKAVFTMIPLGIFFLVSLYKGLITLKQFFAYAIVFCIPVAAYYVYLIYIGIFTTYIFWCWWYNMHYVGPFWPFEHLRTTYAHNTLTWFFYVLALLFFTKTYLQKNLGYLSVALIVIYLFLTRTPYDRYMLAFLPLIAIVSAQAVYEIFYHNKKLFVAVVLLMILGPLDTQTKFWFDIYRGKISYNQESLDRIQYVLNLTEPTDYVYDGETCFNLYRKDIDFFWFGVAPMGCLDTIHRLMPYHYDIYELIEKYKPKVISNYHLDTDNAYIAAHYQKSDRYDDVFIRKI